MLAMLLLSGCFAPDASLIGIDTIPFDNGHQRATDGVLQLFTYDGLLCPDGEPATVFAVYRETITEPMPIAVVFHSGAFDYVLAPDLTDPLARQHYQPDDRLSASWSRTRVFETLGLLDSKSGDPGEENTGVLAGTLLDEGFFALYPANCWGDLWHNETGYHRNDGGEGFERNGRFLAWATTAIASKDPVESANFRTELGMADLPVPLDSSRVYMVGLGDGGRAPMELMYRAGNLPDIQGMILDSVPDNMAFYVANQGSYSDIVTGLDRIYTDDIAQVGAYSTERYIAAHSFNGALKNQLVLYYSSDDPSVPTGTLSALAGQASTHPQMTVVDTGLLEHISINKDISKAQAAVNAMLGE